MRGVLVRAFLAANLFVAILGVIVGLVTLYLVAT
jgi:hypothetical protein